MMSNNSHFDLNINVNAAALVDLLTIGLDRLKTFAKGISDMSIELDALTGAVANNTSVVESAITLINGIAQRIADAGTDPVALGALTAALQAEDAALAAAIAANTVPVVTPVPDPVTPPAP